MSMFDKLKRGRELKEINVQEISLVSMASTGKTFAIIKKKDALGIIDRLQSFIPDTDEDKEILKKIAEGLPADIEPEMSENLDTLVEYRDDLTPDLLEATQILVNVGLGSAMLGPDPQNEEALKEIEEKVAEYKEDFCPELEKSIAYFSKLAENGLPDFDYKNEEEEDEEEEEEKPLFPSLQIAENETMALGKSRRFIGRPIFKPEEEEEEEEDLTPAEEIALLKSEIKKLKKPKSKALMSDDFEEEEEIEKGEFQWTSLCSGE